MPILAKKNIYIYIYIYAPTFSLNLIKTPNNYATMQTSKWQTYFYSLRKQPIFREATGKLVVQILTLFKA